MSTACADSWIKVSTCSPSPSAKNGLRSVITPLVWLVSASSPPVGPCSSGVHRTRPPPPSSPVSLVRYSWMAASRPRRSGSRSPRFVTAWASCATAFLHSPPTCAMSWPCRSWSNSTGSSISISEPPPSASSMRRHSAVDMPFLSAASRPLYEYELRSIFRSASTMPSTLYGSLRLISACTAKMIAPAAAPPPAPPPAAAAGALSAGPVRSTSSPPQRRQRLADLDVRASSVPPRRSRSHPATLRLPSDPVNYRSLRDTRGRSPARVTSAHTSASRSTRLKATSVARSRS